MAILGFFVLVLGGIWMVLSGLSFAVLRKAWSDEAGYVWIVPVITGAALIWFATHFSPFKVTV